jgi:outer membrane protein OmpA-like peptidoglycan-associated protein
MTRLVLALLLAAAALLNGCATPPPPPATERVVLLPGDNGRQSSVIVTRRAGGSVELNQPYATAQLSSATVTTAVTSSADAVQKRYATLLSVQPPRVRSYTLYFEFNRAQLTAESQREVDRILSEAAVVPAAEIDVIGHTDSKGAAEYNDNLGRTRAQSVASLMAGRGFERARISVQSRGEREPLIQTPDETEEPKNRRVEIRLR